MQVIPNKDEFVYWRDHLIVPSDYSVIVEAFRAQRYPFFAHASDRAAKRNIRSTEIEQAIATGHVIEDYPDDKYGPSCLIVGHTQAQRPLHIQVSYPPNVQIITIYEPSIDEWEADLDTSKSNE